MQQRHGTFPRIIGKGDNAFRLTELLNRMRAEGLGDATSSQPESTAPRGTLHASFDSLIIIDRSVDFASLLLTQLTFEGLLDETFTIRHSQAELPSSIVGAPSTTTPNPQAGTTADMPTTNPTLKRKVRLDATDSLYATLRPANFACVGPLLNAVARRLQSSYDARHSTRTPAELSDFVKKLPAYQAEQASLRLHTALAEAILTATRTDAFRAALEVQQSLFVGNDTAAARELLDELVSRAAPLHIVLRLACLESCINGGLRPRDLDAFKRTVVQAYGHRHIVTLDALDKMRLLHARGTGGAASFLPVGGGGGVDQGAATNYAALRKPLALVVDDIDDAAPQDPAYVFSGLAPLSVRLVQCVIQKAHVRAVAASGSAAAITSESNALASKGALPQDGTLGWRGFADQLAQVSGRTFDETPTGGDKGARARETLEGGRARKTTVVFYLGGVTFGELAALRLVAAQLGKGRSLLICTTGIVSGDKAMGVATGTTV